MDGLINFHKPAGLTSAKTLYRVRKLTQQRKSGHAGTLDPAATGVLLLCLGKGTKLVESLMDLPKVYAATARLDVTSASFDSDSPHESVPLPATLPDAASVRAAAAALEGELQQVPPAVSALKLGGQPAYKRRRQGETFVLAPRTVRVYWFVIESFSWPEVRFRVACGRGTYVRALIRDLGAQLGVGGCLTGLTRTQVGPFAADTGWTFDSLATAAPTEYLIPVERVREMTVAARDAAPLRPG